MTKIGIDARLTYYRDGGISTYIRRLVQALEKLDTQNEYTIFHSRKDQKRLSDKFNRAASWTPAHHRIERLALSVELAWRGLDIFHSPDFIAPYRAAKRHIITVHDLTFLHYPQYLTADSRQYYNEQIANSCQHADHILSVSEATKGDLINMLTIPEYKISVQPHGAGEQYYPMQPDETEPIRQALDLPKEGYILQVGTWEPRKNIIGLLKGYKVLLEKMPDAPPVLLVGRKGWLFDETKAEIDILGINEHILWRDNVSDSQLAAVYNMALVNTSVSHYEGFGMPALEGMACGTVPIVSNRSSLPEVVGELGLLVNPDSPENIAEALEKAITDSQWRKEQSKKAIERAKLFTWKQSATIALDAYTSVI
jgi:glycosyltransferase involved in cell wall biosynthesis